MKKELVAILSRSFFDIPLTLQIQTRVEQNISALLDQNTNQWF
jgi:hypothetical protein